jgi:hypothetical protein
MKNILFNNGKKIKVDQDTANLIRDFKIKHKYTENRTLVIGELKDDVVATLIEVDSVIAIY